MLGVSGEYLPPCTGAVAAAMTEAPQMWASSLAVQAVVKQGP